MNSITRLTANIFFAIIISLVFADCAYFGHGFIKASPMNAAIVVFATCFVSSLLICELFSVSKESNKIKNKVRKTHLSKIAKRIAIENARNNRRQRKNTQPVAAPLPQDTGTAGNAQAAESTTVAKISDAPETAQSAAKTGSTAGETETGNSTGNTKGTDTKGSEQEPESPNQDSSQDSGQVPETASKKSAESRKVSTGKEGDAKPAEKISGSDKEGAAPEASAAENNEAPVSGKETGSENTASAGTKALPQEQPKEQSKNTTQAQSSSPAPTPAPASSKEAPQSQSSSKDSAPAAPVQMVSLYVGNLSNDIQASDLENLLKPYGETTKIKIFRDSKGRRRKAYAYVGMAREPAQQAAKALNNTPFQSRTLNVKVSYSS